jgi:hypothetical protein
MIGNGEMRGSVTSPTNWLDTVCTEVLDDVSLKERTYEVLTLKRLMKTERAVTVPATLALTLTFTI